jgi:signal transduction histidine kinase
MPPTVSNAALAERASDGRVSPSSLAIAGAVHDLGNLIQVATSAVNIIARDLEMPAGQRRPALDRARGSLEQAAALARDAIGLIRGQTARAELADVSGCLLEITSMLDARGETDMVLNVDIEPDLPRVRCNPLGLQSALLNLLLNARNAMAGRGVVSVSASRGRGELVVETIEITVTDGGGGMSPEIIARALDPFFTTKTDGTGGLGLPMVDRFVRESGGSLSIDSKPGVGTSVTVRLPTVPNDNKRGNRVGRST